MFHSPIVSVFNMKLLCIYVIKQFTSCIVDYQCFAVPLRDINSLCTVQVVTSCMSEWYNVLCLHCNINCQSALLSPQNIYLTYRSVIPTKLSLHVPGDRL